MGMNSVGRYEPGRECGLWELVLAGAAGRIHRWVDTVGQSINAAPGGLSSASTCSAKASGAAPGRVDRNRRHGQRRARPILRRYLELLHINLAHARLHIRPIIESGRKFRPIISPHRGKSPKLGSGAPHPNGQPPQGAAEWLRTRQQGRSFVILT